MKIKPGFVLRNIAGENVVIPVGNAFADNRIMLTLNETASFIWRKLSTSVEVEEIVAALCDEYEIAEQEATTDVIAFCNELCSRNMLEA